MKSQYLQHERQQSHHQPSLFDTLIGKGSDEDMPNIPEDKKRKKRHDQSRGLGL